MDPLEPVNSIVPAIPMHIGNAIERAMSLDAQHRFSSVEQFWEALWLILAEQPAPVFDKPSVPKDPPAVPTPGPEWAIGQTIEKPVREPLPVVPVLENIEELKELDVVPVPESIEEQVDQDTEQPLPVVPVLESIEEQEQLDIEKPPPVVPVLRESMSGKIWTLKSRHPLYAYRSASKSRKTWMQKSRCQSCRQLRLLASKSKRV